MSETTNKSVPLLPVKAGDGIYLRGLVVAVETLDREWENTKYRQLKATIATGGKIFNYVADDKKGPLPEVEAFRRINVTVEYATTEKGVITVRGPLSYE